MLRSFATLPDALLATAAGVACDLDDTLTTHGVLTPGPVRALHDLAAAHIPCVIVTGRPLGWGEVIARLLPVRAVVAENGGAWIARESRGMRVAFLEDESTRAIGMTRAERMADDLCHAIAGLERVRDLTRRVTDIALDIHEAANVSDADVARAMAMVRDAGLCSIASTVHLHVSAHPPDKLAGLRAAVQDMTLDASAIESRWIYVGDSPNDAAPFAAMNLSIGVANVRAFEGRMTAWPGYVTDGACGDGFVEVVDRLLAARRRG